MITLLGGEVLCSLGKRKERIAHLREGRSLIHSKRVVSNGETFTYPYCLIDHKARGTDKVMALSYMKQAINSALSSVDLDNKALKRTGLFLGSSSIDYSVAHILEESLDPASEEKVAYERVGNGYYARELEKAFGFGGIAMTYNTACTSSANALMDAASMLQNKLIDYAVVVGFELFAPVSLEGFAGMQLLSPDVMRPFDKERNGIVLGEAVSAVVLSRDDVAPSPWRYLGGVSNCETYSVTGANPDGKDISKVMRRALEQSATNAHDIVAVKAHGTASELNDVAEANAMKQVFERVPPFLSIKPYIGHTLGGCGSAELLLFMECVDAGFVPQSLNFSQCHKEEGLAPLRQPLETDSGKFMMNFFGFGGNNTSFVIEKLV